MIKMRDIYLGSIDARNEVFSQEKEEIDIFNAAFVVPPTIDMDQIARGARYFITGPKGSGKTALLMNLKHRIEKEKNAKTFTLLFKSDLTEIERQRLLLLSDTTIDSGMKDIRDLYDYKHQWLWYIYSTIANLISPDDIIGGAKDLQFVKMITNPDGASKNSIFSNLKISKIKSKIRAAMNSGALSAELSADIDLDEISSKDENLSDVVGTIERKLRNISLRPDSRICIFFDEIELFVDRSDQRDRDLRLIRDLVYAVNRANRNIASAVPGVSIYASLRSEILSELNRLEPEIRRSIKDFAAAIAWNSKSDPNNHPLLDIFIRKINESETNVGADITINVWDEYFPLNFKGKNFRKFLLDISMLKPRNIVRFLSIIKENNLDKSSVKDVDMDEYMSPFSLEVWEEIEEEIMTTYDSTYTAAIKSIFTLIDPEFNVKYIDNRISEKYVSDILFRKIARGAIKSKQLLEMMYRFGAVGNKVRNKNGSGGQIDRWVFRDYPDPDFSQNFTVHQSLRKTLQITSSRRAPPGPPQGRRRRPYRRGESAGPAGSA